MSHIFTYENMFLLTFGFRNHKQMSRGPLLPNHEYHSARLLGCCHGEDESMLPPLERHLVHLVLLQRTVAQPPDTVAHVGMAQLAHEHGILSRRHRHVFQLCNNSHALCGGRRS